MPATLLCMTRPCALRCVQRCQEARAWTRRPRGPDFWQCRTCPRTLDRGCVPPGPCVMPQTCHYPTAAVLYILYLALPSCRGLHAGEASERRERAARGSADVHSVLDVLAARAGKSPSTSPASPPSQACRRPHPPFDGASMHVTLGLASGTRGDPPDAMG